MNNIIIALPANAFSVGSVQFNVNEYGSGTAPAIVTGSGIEFLLNSNSYSISILGGAQPIAPVTLTFPYNSGQIPSGFGQGDLTVLTNSTNSSSGWSATNVIGITNNSITVVTSHFSWWAVGVLLHATLTPTPAVAPGAAYLSANVFHDLSDAPLTVQYNDAGGDPLAITIHTATGALVRNLTVTSGASSATWDGKDDGGSSASTGLYLVAVRQANGTTILRKVVVLKQ